MTEADTMQVAGASTAASDVAPPEIGTRAIATFFRYFERELGRERLLRAVKRIGGEPTLDVLDPENFVSLEDSVRDGPSGTVLRSCNSRPRRDPESERWAGRELQ